MQIGETDKYKRILNGSMKKGASGFKERYGKRAKEVMYATATKQAKKVAEDVEQIDELSKKTLANYMRANTKRMADTKNPDSMERKMKRHDDYFKASKKFHEAKGPTSDYGLETFATNESPSTPLSRVKDLARSSMSKIKNEMLGKAGATSEEIDPSVRTTDTLKGRVAGGKKDDVGPKADGKSTKVKFTPGPK